SAQFAVRMGDAVVVLARTSGPGVFQPFDRVGVVSPAHCTAPGKVMLAALPPDQFEWFLARAELKVLTANIIASPERLRREIAEVRRAGMGVRRRRIRSGSALRRAACARFLWPGHRRHRHFRSGLAAVDRYAAEARAPSARRRRPAIGGIRLR